MSDIFSWSCMLLDFNEHNYNTYTRTYINTNNNNKKKNRYYEDLLLEET